MSLRPIEGQPGYFVDTATNRVYNINKFQVLDRTFSFKRSKYLELQPPPGETWAIQSFSVVVHPWPETISPSLIVELAISNSVEAQKPLFTIAEPLARPEDEGLRKRLEEVEEQLKHVEIRLSEAEARLSEGKPYTLEAPREPVEKKWHRIVRDKDCVKVEIKDPLSSNDFIYEQAEVFELRLRGLKR